MPDRFNLWACDLLMYGKSLSGERRKFHAKRVAIGQDDQCPAWGRARASVSPLEAPAHGALPSMYPRQRGAALVASVAPPGTAKAGELAVYNLNHWAVPGSLCTHHAHARTRGMGSVAAGEAVSLGHRLPPPNRVR